jgi:hypothetical protein
LGSSGVPMWWATDMGGRGDTQTRKPALRAGFCVGGRWSRHSDLNRGPAVYEVDRPKRCGMSVECRAYAVQLAGLRFAKLSAQCSTVSTSRPLALGTCVALSADTPRLMFSLATSAADINVCEELTPMSWRAVYAFPTLSPIRTPTGIMPQPSIASDGTADADREDSG